METIAIILFFMALLALGLILFGVQITQKAVNIIILLLIVAEAGNQSNWFGLFK